MLDLADFAFQEQPEDNSMVAISRAWYNGTYTMTAKPIKTLELHYTMILFLIILFVLLYFLLEEETTEPITTGKMTKKLTII